MKKIITALTVTALAISSVFAQAKVEYTQKAFLYSPKGNKMELAGYDGMDGNIKFEVKNAQAGAWLTVKANLGTAEKYNGSGTYADNTGKAPAFSEYAGWVKFGDGSFKLQSGRFDARAANRFTGLAGKWQGDLYERYKLGIPELKDSSDTVVSSNVGKDVDNYGCLNGSKVLTSFVEYAGEAVTARAALNANNYGTLDLKSGFSFNAVTTIGEGTKLVADLKLPSNNAFAFAVFAENTSLKENLDFLVGFTFVQSKSGTKLSTSANNFEAAIDLRAKYALGDSLGLTTMNNFAYYGTTTKPVFCLWDMVSLDMPVTDKIKAFFTVQWEYKDLFHEATGGHHGELDFVPSVQYSPVKGVDMTLGLIMATYGWSRPDTTMFSVPLLLHVSL